jgi:hypothetical protein
VHDEVVAGPIERDGAEPRRLLLEERLRAAQIAGALFARGGHERHRAQGAYREPIDGFGNR